MSVHQPATGDGDSGDRPDFPLSDTPLLDLLDALVNGPGQGCRGRGPGRDLRPSAVATGSVSSGPAGVGQG